MVLLLKKLRETCLRRNIARATRYSIHKIMGAICNDIHLTKIAITEVARIDEDWAVDAIADMACFCPLTAQHGLKTLKNIRSEHAVWAITHIGLLVPAANAEAVQILRVIARMESTKGGEIFMSTCSSLAALTGTPLMEEMVRQKANGFLVVKEARMSKTITPHERGVMRQHQVL